MKVVDIAEFYSERGGGVRTYIHQKLAAAAGHGVEMVVIAPGAEDRVQACDGGRIIWIKGRPHPLDRRYFQLGNGAAVYEMLNAEKPQVVEGSSPWIGGRLAAGWQGNAVKSLFVHQDPVAVYAQTFLDGYLGETAIDGLCAWFWAYLRKLNARFDTTIVSGQWLADRLAARGLRHTHAVPFGIAKHDFSPARRDADVRRNMLAACGIVDPNATLLIAVARHHPEKRLGTLIKAVELASRERSIGLYIIGDGPMRSWTERKAARVKGVHVAGFMTDRAALSAAMASADAFLHGSAAETFGIAVAEALCSGLPLIVPHAGGAGDLAARAYAETYPPGDVTACAAAIGRLLKRDRALLSQAAVVASQFRVAEPDQHFRALFAHYDRMVQAHDAVAA